MKCLKMKNRVTSSCLNPSPLGNDVWPSPNSNKMGLTLFTKIDFLILNMAKIHFQKMFRFFIEHFFAEFLEDYHNATSSCIVQH
jgi:hypothetical protein